MSKPRPNRRLIGSLDDTDGPSTRPAVEVEGVIEWATERAILVEFPEWGEKAWLPRSQICHEGEITYASDTGDEGTVVLPEWLWDRLEPVTERRTV